MMVLQILCRRQQRKCLSQLIARHCSTTPNENVIVAKSLMDHIDSMTESNSSQFLNIRKLKEKIAHLHDEYMELSAIDPSDELATIAQEECSTNSVKIRKLLKESGQFLISLNKYDTQDAYLEVTAGAGGLEAGVFAGEILNLYLGYIRHLGFEYSIEEQEYMRIHISKDFPNSIVRAKVSVHGCDVFHSLKYECGVHRVQRFPYIGSKNNKIKSQFTITCSVAVLPQPRKEDMVIEASDILEEKMFPSDCSYTKDSNNKTAVRLVHLPTGISVKNQEECKYETNKKLAMAALRTIIYNQQFEDERSQMVKVRKNQMGNLDRNERIRSYNFNRRAISDHRLGIVKQVPNIASFLQGANGYDILEDFKEQLDDINGIESLKDYLANCKNKS